MTGRMQAAACYGEMRVPAVPDRNGGEYGAIPLAWLCILRQKYWGALNQAQFQQHGGRNGCQGKRVKDLKYLRNCFVAAVLATALVAAAATEPGYVGRQVCASCHAKENEAWRGSHHDLAMQEPTAKTVLGDFAGRNSATAAWYPPSSNVATPSTSIPTARTANWPTSRSSMYSA